MPTPPELSCSDKPLVFHLRQFDWHEKLQPCSSKTALLNGELDWYHTSKSEYRFWEQLLHLWGGKENWFGSVISPILTQKAGSDIVTICWYIYKANLLNSLPCCSLFIIPHSSAPAATGKANTAWRRLTAERQQFGSISYWLLQQLLFGCLQ